MNWLIKETYGDIFGLVDYFTEYAWLQGETVEDMWWGLLFKKELWPYYYISRSVEGEPILLLRAGACTRVCTKV